MRGIMYQVLRPARATKAPGPDDVGHDDVGQVVYKARTETGHLFDSLVTTTLQRFYP